MGKSKKEQIQVQFDRRLDFILDKEDDIRLFKKYEKYIFENEHFLAEFSAINKLRQDIFTLTDDRVREKISEEDYRTATAEKSSTIAKKIKSLRNVLITIKGTLSQKRFDFFVANRLKPNNQIGIKDNNNAVKTLSSNKRDERHVFVYANNHPIVDPYGFGYEGRTDYIKSKKETTTLMSFISEKKNGPTTLMSFISEKWMSFINKFSSGRNNESVVNPSVHPNKKITNKGLPSGKGDSQIENVGPLVFDFPEIVYPEKGTPAIDVLPVDPVSPDAIKKLDVDATIHTPSKRENVKPKEETRTPIGFMSKLSSRRSKEPKANRSVRKNNGITAKDSRKGFSTGKKDPRTNDFDPRIMMGSVKTLSRSERIPAKGEFPKGGQVKSNSASSKRSDRSAGSRSVFSSRSRRAKNKTGPVRLIFS